MNNKNQSLITAMMYFLITGCCCLLVGSSLTQLMSLYNLSLDKVVVLGSVFALGRVTMVNFAGNMARTKGTRFCVMLGGLGFSIFLFGLGLIHNYYVAYALCFIGGCSQAMQDTVTPILVARASKENYTMNMSIGQALFGAGCFLTPFLIMVMLKMSIPFYVSYLIMGFMALCLIYMGYLLKDEDDEQEEEEMVIPIHVGHFKRTVVYMFIVLFFYSSLIGAYCTYTTSYGEFIGMAEADASLLLTLFNVGSMMGSFAFAPVLKKVNEVDLMNTNLCVSMVLLGLALYFDSALLKYALFTVIGFTLGVIFGIAISTITRICYKDIKAATPRIGFLSGLADVLTPVATGAVIARVGIMFSMEYIAVATVICIILGILVRKDMVE